MTEPRDHFPFHIPHNLRHFLLMVLIFVTASLIGYLFRHASFPDTNIVIVYLLAVLLTVWLTNSFIFGLVASVLATFLFNYFFAAPLFTFSVNDPSYTVTFITMTVAALAASILTSHARQSARAGREKEVETKAIYHLTNHLTEAKDLHDIAGIAVTAISECFACNAACLCFDENGGPEPTFIQQTADGTQVRREVADIRALRHHIERLRTSYDAGREFHDWPIYGRENILGIVRIPKVTAVAMKEPQMRLLRSMIESIALAMDRFRSVQQRLKSREETIMERYRANLLRAISHDIRTPLSGIIGTSEMLMDMTAAGDPRFALAQSVRKDADWLHSLVENILSLTRLQDGKLTIEKQREAVEEIIGEAVNHFAGRAPEYEIMVRVPEELLLISMDARLIEQVIINLLDNAIKHTEPTEEISIMVELDQAAGLARFTVRDGGVGINRKELPHIFQMFYTTDDRRVGTRPGIGLGLAICETIVRAHGGTIEARNRTDGPGAEFIFTLPLEDERR